MSHPNPLYRLLAACAVLLCFAGGALAERQDYTANVGGTTRTPNVLVYYAEDAAYVPLLDLALQLGGSGRVVSPGVAELNINGRVATISINNLRFDADGASHSVSKPFLGYESEVLAARDDVAALFKTAFGIDLSGANTPAATEGEVAALDEELPMLESVALPPPAETAAPAEEPALLETEAIAAPEASEGAAEGAVEEAAEEAPVRKGKIRTILIDAGHGGNDPGVQAAGGATEKDICLAVAMKLAELLKEDNAFSVVMTRSEDKTLPMAERATLAKQQDGVFIVSIHTGASLSAAAKGPELFYSGDFARSRVSDSQWKGAAETLAASLSSETGAPLRGVRRAPIQLLQLSDAAGCQVELGCLSNAEEAARLASADYQEKAARGLAIGLRKLAGEN